MNTETNSNNTTDNETIADIAAQPQQPGWFRRNLKRVGYAAAAVVTVGIAGGVTYVVLKARNSVAA